MMAVSTISDKTERCYRQVCAAAADMSTMSRQTLLLPLLSLALLGGCDYLGLETTQQIAERTHAEGKAVGGACRHAGRAIEDCYAFNPSLPKAAIFEGWREMNEYMLKNRIPEIKPEIEPSPPRRAAPRPAEGAPASK
jgi:hypothetical protein